MKGIYTALIALAFVLVPASAFADNDRDDDRGERHGRGNAYGHYKNVNYNYSAPVYTSTYINDLIRQLQALQVQLARLNNSYTNSSDDARRIEVVYKNSAAYITIDYTNGDEDDFIAGVDNNADVIDFIISATNLSRSEILSTITFSRSGSNDNNEDVDSIDVTIDRDDNEAVARVRFEDGDTDTFRYNTDDKDEIVNELSDDLDISKGEVRDIIDYEYDDSGSNNDDDIADIDVYFSGDDAIVVVRFDDNRTKNYRYNNEDDEDDIITMLADDLDVSENDIEDVIDFH